MNINQLLKRQAETGRPIRVGVIGAGKFSTMFLAQVRITPGMQLVGIAELDPQKAKQACLRVGFPEDSLSLGSSTTAINDGARSGKTILTDDSDQLIQAEVDVILEITGVPEAGARHACRALEAGKHLVHIGELVRKGWSDLSKKYRFETQIGGMKPLSHFSIESDVFDLIKAYFIQLMLEKGFLASNLFYSMFAHTDQHVNDYLCAVDSVFSEIAQTLEDGCLSERLKGKPSSFGFKRLT